MNSPRRLALLPLLLVGCSDYSFTGPKDPNKDPEQGDTGGDTGPGGGAGGDGQGDGGGGDSSSGRCEDQSFPPSAVETDESCEASGTTVGSFTPTVEWRKSSWAVGSDSSQIMMMPAVGSLTDDDGDGDADQDDVPDIVVITYSNYDYGANYLRVISGDGGAEHLNLRIDRMQGQGGVALADINNDGWQDIIVPTTGGTVIAIDHSGATLWESAYSGGGMYGTSDNPAVADLNGDGNPEIICGAAIWDNAGRLVGLGSAGKGNNPDNVGTATFGYDIDGDGQQEVVAGNALYRRDGSAIWSNGQRDGYPAVGNFDSDSRAEVVVTAGGQIRLQDDNGAILCSAAIPGATSSYYGGPPTVADFDGDGEAEFAAAAGSRYSVFERDCSVKWQAVTQDASSGNTGSAVFDFEGDGIAEAVYADETRLWVFSGPDGAIKLESSDHSNATWLEYPPIADVDGDGQAEIVVPNTEYTTSVTGLVVIGDADRSWRPGRRIWNQHAYSITNIDDDGRVPATPVRNVEVFNSFRSGDLTTATGTIPLPNLTVEIVDVCVDECGSDRLWAWVTVANTGVEAVAAGTRVALLGAKIDGTTDTLAEITLMAELPPGSKAAAEQVVLEAGANEIIDLRASVDGGAAASPGVVNECAEDDNDTRWSGPLCGG
ncbi:MAG: VCBS repeat-containing protein [Deltaproteobacteria bacterium]|nr:VCBS repeat-containing protein [Deltaproteobacteria bacterium]